MSAARDLIVRALQRLTGVASAQASAPAAPSTPKTPALSEEAILAAFESGSGAAEVGQDSVPLETSAELVDTGEPIELQDVEEESDVLQSVTPPLGTPVPQRGNGAATTEGPPVIQVGLQTPPTPTPKAPESVFPASTPEPEESTPVIETARAPDPDEEPTVENELPIIEVSPDADIAADDAKRLSDTLKQLERVAERDEIARVVLGYAKGLFDRAALFVIKREMVAGWEGQGAGMTRKNIRAILIPLTTPSIFKTVFETKVLYYGGVPRTTVNDLFLNAVATQSAPSRVVVLPFVLKGKVVCTLYADGAQAEDLSPRMIGQLYQLGRAVSAAFEQLILKTKKTRAG